MLINLFPFISNQVNSFIRKYFSFVNSMLNLSFNRNFVFSILQEYILSRVWLENRIPQQD